MWNRRCTDLICLLLFVGMWIGLIVVFMLGMANGDLAMLRYDADYLGERCGVGDLSDRRKAFYPRLGQDIAEQGAVVRSGAWWNLRLYTLCVEDCPKGFSVEAPVMVPDQNFNPAAEPVAYNGVPSRAEWPSVLPTEDMMNRCLPRMQASEEGKTSCIYPNCTSSVLLGLPVECDAGANDGSWMPCDDGSFGCYAAQAACVVDKVDISGVVFQPSGDSELGKEVMELLSSAANDAYEMAASIFNSVRWVFLGGVLLPVVGMAMYMLVLRWVAGAALYMMFFLCLGALIAGTGLCYARSGMELMGVGFEDMVKFSTNNQTGVSWINDPQFEAIHAVDEHNDDMYQVAFWMMMLLDLIFVIAAMVMRKRIRTAIVIVREASEMLAEIPMVVLFPFFSMAAQCAVFVWLCFGLALTVTTSAETFEKHLLVLNATMGDAAETFSLADTADYGTYSGEDARRGLVAFQLVGFIWTIQFLQACAWTMLSGAICYWYFYRNHEDARTRFPLARSVGRVLRYHLGSMAFASLIMAVCKVLRYILTWIDYQTRGAQAHSMMLRLVLKCFRCAAWCLEKTIRFISFYGLVFVALDGCSFCSGCASTFKLITAFPAQVAINTVVQKILMIPPMIGVPVGCAFVTYTLIEEYGEDTRNPVYPALLVFVMALMIVLCMITVFECAITTLFICAFHDLNQYSGKHMSEKLRSALQLTKTKPVGSDTTVGKSGTANESRGSTQEVKIAKSDGLQEVTC